MKLEIRGATAGVALCLGALGCRAENQLEPAQTANEVAGLEDAIVASNNGVRMVAQVDTWDGEARITQEVTPVRVSIENQSDNKVALRYENFQLVGGDGAVYRALPPLRIEGEVPLEDPDWTYSGFEVAPYYGPVYPGMLSYGGPFYTAPDYYGSYYGYLANVQLPTLQMRLRALPEGVLNAGGSVEGFLYFQKVDANQTERVMLQAQLTTPEQNSPVASLSLPFEVED